MKTTMWLACGLAMTLMVVPGCKGKKGGATVVEAPVIEEERPEFGSADEQRKAAEENAVAGSAEAKAADPEIAWGKKVSTLTRNLAATLINCNDKYFKALKPDELLVGKPALVTTDGVVTVMADACDSILEELELGTMLLDGKHPKSDELLAQWTLLADMYKRVSKSAINAGAKPKRRKLNHGEMVVLLPIMTKELVPGIMATIAPFLKLNEASKPMGSGAAFTKVSKVDAITQWAGQMQLTKTDLLKLDAEYVEKIYTPMMGDLYPRRRYVKWLTNSWKRRLALEKAQASRTTTGDSKFDDAMRASVAKYHEAVDAY
ncbi:MAG: hypothetical protein ACI9WU_004780, partial [Myxococcota bacterium]